MSVVTYRSKLEKRFGVHLRQGYVNKITEMPNNGTVPPGNADIIHRLILGKTRPGIEIRNWKQGWVLQNVQRRARDDPSYLYMHEYQRIPRQSTDLTTRPKSKWYKYYSWRSLPLVVL